MWEIELRADQLRTWRVLFLDRTLFVITADTNNSHRDSCLLHSMWTYYYIRLLSVFLASVADRSVEYIYRVVSTMYTSVFHFFRLRLVSSVILLVTYSLHWPSVV